MNNDGLAKNQHYVPQFLLKNFAHKKNKVHVFEKNTDRQFIANTKNIASENGFYNFELGPNNLPYTLEKSLSRLEEKASNIIKSIIEKKSLAHLSEEQRFNLAYFVAVQFVRTRDFREHFKDSCRQFREVVSERFGEALDPNFQDATQALETEGALKRYTAESLMGVKDELLPYFLDKHWTLYEAPKGDFFYIGDNPVTRFNILPNRHGGSNIGLALKGIEIYLPISSKLSLALHCPELLQDLNEKVMTLNNSTITSDRLDNSTELLSKLFSGDAVYVEPEQVIHLNSLQVIFSNRYIFSAKNDFELATQMISDNAELRTGIRSVVK